MLKIAIALLFSICSLQANALQVTLSADTDGSSTPMIFGTTNLPNGTALMVSVERPQTDWGGDSKTTVVDGKFKAGPFGPPGKGLSPGTYTLTVTMPVPAAQSPEIRNEVGLRGEKLTGQLVRTDSITGGKHAVYTSSFRIAGKADAKRDAQEQAEREISNKVQFCSDGCLLHSKGVKLSYDICMRSCLRP